MATTKKAQKRNVKKNLTTNDLGEMILGLTKTVSEHGEMITHIVASMADLATKDDIAEVNQTLDDHTRRLNIIETDVKHSLDKRLQLDVRVVNLEKKVFGTSQEKVFA